MKFGAPRSEKPATFPTITVGCDFGVRWSPKAGVGDVGADGCSTDSVPSRPFCSHWPTLEHQGVGWASCSPKSSPDLKFQDSWHVRSCNMALQRALRGISIILSQGWNLRIDSLPSKFHAIFRSSKLLREREIACVSLCVCVCVVSFFAAGPQLKAHLFICSINIICLPTMFYIIFP